MKKLWLLCLIAVSVLSLSGCDLFGDKDKDNDPNNYPDWIRIEDNCEGYSNYLVINGECVLIKDIVSEEITISSDETRVEYFNSVELMSDFVADIIGSKGLAVVPRDVFEGTLNTGGAQPINLMNLAASTTEEEITENIIVKLNADGFFEEVGFTDEAGNNVSVTSNPLALEVFGPYTIVIFEVDLGYDNSMTNFTQRIYDSLHAGGIYLIHNNSGKMFATKNVEYVDNSYSYTEDHSRNVSIMVTLNEPVTEIQHILRVDEFNQPVLDENGKEIFDEVSVPILDKDGNPIIITEGPILTEIKEVPVVEYYKVQQVDDNGNLVFDENGEPVFDIIEDPKLDENGNPVTEQREVAVLDENGEIQYQQQFQMEFFINDLRTITVSQYYGQVTDNPISGVAQRFVDQVVAEYYNWNYYRVNNYMLSAWGFASGDEDIFYMEDKQNNQTQAMERFVMKLSFDSETNELVLEDYINATKAGFTNCEIILDPRNNNIICDSWDANVKVYSQTEGLKTIANSENLNPVTFPNGELYFYDARETYVAELGYYTTLLYNINSNGTMESHYIELGEREEVCYGSCTNYLTVQFLDQNGNEYGYESYLDMQRSDGEPIIEHADLELTSIGEFDSTRPECTDSNGCWYMTLFDLFDGEELVGTFEGYFTAYPGDTVPPYRTSYQLDEFTTYEYMQKWSDIDEICDSAIGCNDYVSLIDETISTNGIYIYDNIITDFGDPLIQEIVLNETNNAVYEYTKVTTGLTCVYDSCDEEIPVRIYDNEHNMIAQGYQTVHIAQNDIIPVYLEYEFSDDTVVTYKTGLCTSSNGCWEYYWSDNSLYFNIQYKQGDTMYETIQFADTDVTYLEEDTVTNELCTNIDGCYVGDLEYIITDALGNEVYHFTTYSYAEYGYRVPFKVTATLDDITIHTQKEYLSETAVCEDTICRLDVELAIGLQNDYDSLGWGRITIQNGDPIVYRIFLDSDAVPTSTVEELVCKFDDGCDVFTTNFTIIDDNGNELDYNENYYTSLLVHFAKDDVIPTSENFEVTFTMTNIEYRMSRLNIYDFIHNLNNVIILDTNLYLIERNSWSQGQDNVILTYNETTGRYAAVYTNISAVTEISKLGNGYVAINDDETAIIKFEFNVDLSTNNYYFFDVTNLTEGLSINGVNDLIIDYDGSIYFKGVDNFIQDITGTITENGVVTIDTEFVERQVVRLSPIN